ncbi:MAG: nucleotidyltransferase substrate binding protein [Niameybacter sp.]|uniref:nucleotidyltransferase substrate binding protein n=1 Tax=Niameybacter sp. TaxID=2033640 RepID=UPI002FCA2D47
METLSSSSTSLVFKLKKTRLFLEKAYVSGLLEEEKVWLQLLEDRNATLHIYSEKLADEIAGRICTIYVQAIGGLVKTLKEMIQE